MSRKKGERRKLLATLTVGAALIGSGGGCDKETEISKDGDIFVAGTINIGEEPKSTGLIAGVLPREMSLVKRENPDESPDIDICKEIAKFEGECSIISIFPEETDGIKSIKASFNSGTEYTMPIDFFPETGEISISVEKGGETHLVIESFGEDGEILYDPFEPVIHANARQGSASGKIWGESPELYFEDENDELFLYEAQETGSHTLSANGMFYVLKKTGTPILFEINAEMFLEEGEEIFLYPIEDISINIEIKEK